MKKQEILKKQEIVTEWLIMNVLPTFAMFIMFTLIILVSIIISIVSVQTEMIIFSVMFGMIAGITFYIAVEHLNDMILNDIEELTTNLKEDVE